jgi:myosin-1
LCPKTWPKYKGEPRDGVIEICTHLKYELDNDYSLGRSKIFIRSSKTFFALEEHFGLRKMVLASKIKALYKGYKQRCEYKKIKHAGIYKKF